MSTEQETSKNTSPTENDEWERSLISDLARSALDEKRKARKWGIFFKSLLVVYVVFVTIAFSTNGLNTDALGGDKHTALIDIVGVISQGEEASADAIVTGLRKAFKDENTAGVIIRINSPGGSPVQAGYVNDEIYRLRAKYPDIPLYAVIADICASGGYYIAAAADQIYADKASIVGSIGVRMDGFGFVDALDKLGVERRLLTAGKHKALLDPFSPVKDDEVAHLKTLLSDIHQQFINTVKKGRRDRLANNDDLFSGLFWTGEQGLELGLVDALGSSSYVAREIIKAEDIVNFTPRKNYLDQFAKRLGASITAAFSQGMKLN